MTDDSLVVYEASSTGHYLELFPKKNMSLGTHNLNTNEEIIAKIIKVEKGIIKNNLGKEEEVVFLHFDPKHKIMPMVCNITNGRILASLYGDKHADWIGNSIQIYSGEVRSPKGGMTQGLCIRHRKPDVGESIDKYVKGLERCETMEALAMAFKAIPKHLKPRCTETKDKMKEILNG